MEFSNSFLKADRNGARKVKFLFYGSVELKDGRYASRCLKHRVGICLYLHQTPATIVTVGDLHA